MILFIAHAGTISVSNKLKPSSKIHKSKKRRLKLTECISLFNEDNDAEKPKKIIMKSFKRERKKKKEKAPHKME